MNNMEEQIQSTSAPCARSGNPTASTNTTSESSAIALQRKASCINLSPYAGNLEGDTMTTFSGSLESNTSMIKRIHTWLGFPDTTASCSISHIEFNSLIHWPVQEEESSLSGATSVFDSLHAPECLCDGHSFKSIPNKIMDNPQYDSVLYPAATSCYKDHLVRSNLFSLMHLEDETKEDHILSTANAFTAVNFEILRDEPNPQDHDVGAMPPSNPNCDNESQLSDDSNSGCQDACLQCDMDIIPPSNNVNVPCVSNNRVFVQTKPGFAYYPMPVIQHYKNREFQKSSTNTTITERRISPPNTPQAEPSCSKQSTKKRSYAESRSISSRTSSSPSDSSTSSSRSTTSSTSWGSTIRSYFRRTISSDEDMEDEGSMRARPRYFTSSSTNTSSSSNSLPQRRRRQCRAKQRFGRRFFDSCTSSSSSSWIPVAKRRRVQSRPKRRQPQRLRPQRVSYYRSTSSSNSWIPVAKKRPLQPKKKECLQSKNKQPTKKVQPRKAKKQPKKIDTQRLLKNGLLHKSASLHSSKSLRMSIPLRRSSRLRLKSLLRMRKRSTKSIQSLKNIKPKKSDNIKSINTLKMIKSLKNNTQLQKCTKQLKNTKQQKSNKPQKRTKQRKTKEPLKRNESSRTIKRRLSYKTSKQYRRPKNNKKTVATRRSRRILTRQGVFHQSIKNAMLKKLVIRMEKIVQLA